MLLFACVTVTVTRSFQCVFNQVDGTNGKTQRPSDPNQFTTASKTSTATPPNSTRPSFSLALQESELDQRAHRQRGLLGAAVGHTIGHHCRNSEAQTTTETPRKFS